MFDLKRCMKTDLQVQKDVMVELQWEPYLRASEIGVTVKDGVVTLSGVVDSFPKKLVAEKAAARVAGVKAVAEEIRVGLPAQTAATDAEIAHAAVLALKWLHISEPDTVRVKVEDGVITLDGEVAHDYQRKNAQSSVSSLQGVRAVVNRMALRSQLVPEDLTEKIRSAFIRHATVDAGNIHTEIQGATVVLTGTVRSLIEKQDAEQIVWAAPGVSGVDNRLEVSNGQ